MNKQFTMVELVIIFAVIAVFAALLTPVLNASQSSGLVASCMNNLKSNGAALANYRAENDDCFLPAINTQDRRKDGTYNTRDWLEQAMCNDASGIIRKMPLFGTRVIMKSSENNVTHPQTAGRTMYSSVNLLCPSARKHISPRWQSRQFVFTDYAYNAHIIEKKYRSKNGNRNVITKGSEAINPEKSVLMGDAVPRNIVLKSANIFLSGTGKSNVASYGSAGAHGKNMNQLFMDGHCEALAGIYVDQNGYVAPWWDGAQVKFTSAEF